MWIRIQEQLAVPLEQVLAWWKSDSLGLNVYLLDDGVVHRVDQLHTAEFDALIALESLKPGVPGSPWALLSGGLILRSDAVMSVGLAATGQACIDLRLVNGHHVTVQVDTTIGEVIVALNAVE